MPAEPPRPLAVDEHLGGRSGGQRHGIQLATGDDGRTCTNRENSALAVNRYSLNAPVVVTVDDAGG